jgi:hypothetical protein
MKKCFSLLVSILFMLPVGPAVAEDGVAIVEFVVRHNARAQQAREVADAGYLQRIFQNAKVTGTLTEKYFSGTDKNTTDYTTTTDTTQAGTTAAITLSIPLLDSREARERTRDMLTTVQSIRETALSVFNQLKEKQATARNQSARLKELSAYVAWLQERVDAGVDYQKELFKEKLVLMKEQEALDIAHTQVTTLTDSLLGLVDEGSRPQLKTMLRERW